MDPTTRESVVKKKSKPHAVCMPVPAQSHISSLLYLAKLLHQKGFYITFVNTQFNHNRILRSRGPNSLEGLNDFHFETIPDGLPPSDPNATQDVMAIKQACRYNFLSPLRKLFSKLMDQLPHITLIIADTCLSCLYQIGNEFQVPVAFFWPMSACALMAVQQFGSLKDKGYIPIKGYAYSNCTDEYLDTTVDWIPGMRNMRLRDFPTYIRTTDPNDWNLTFFLEEFQNTLSNASATIINTFTEFEPDLLEALSHVFPNIYPIGPLHLLTNQILQTSPLNSIRINMWKEDSECIRWLDTRNPESVIYVNFGSILMITSEQLVELAWGLADSKCDFLWVIRPDLVQGDSIFLSPEFEKETRYRGYVTSWCPQEQVLNHKSIGGFITHSGWNSTLESLCAGVPLICWPWKGDQHTNSRYSHMEWGIGIPIEDNNLTREVVKRTVKELMFGEDGKIMKKRVHEWKRIAKEAIAQNGSSSLNLDKLVNDAVLKFGSV